MARNAIIGKTYNFSKRVASNIDSKKCRNINKKSNFQGTLKYICSIVEKTRVLPDL